MFTGIVEKTGKVQRIRKTSKSAILTITAPEICQGMKIGDSIAVNGACLTVISHSTQDFIVELMEETWCSTNLKYLHLTSPVNLERALQLGDHLGGHLVNGHIDTLGRLISIKRQDSSKIFEIQLNKKFISYLIEKGSIAVDGVSLTIIEVKRNSFTTGLIPHTLTQTTLGLRRVGDELNIEIDQIAKYCKQFTHR
ncbi:MAG: riboflavin synthase [Candidatus Edwardsbacteria bacterium]